jgi:predicted nucleic acid-binding protein
MLDTNIISDMVRNPRGRAASRTRRHQDELCTSIIVASDLFIAAHARCFGIILVTANVREFSRVQGLKVENWIA